MRFEIGAAVHVTSLGKGVVRAVRNGRYLVEVKGRAMLVEETQLTVIEGGRGSTRPVPEQGRGDELTRTNAPASLDLHGMTVDEAIAAVDEFLSDAILAGHAEVQVIHGRSGGKLRDAVHRRFKQVHAVRSFRLDPRNPGATLVML
jgi:DNA mismatch repair protein MutS2